MSDGKLENDSQPSPLDTYFSPNIAKISATTPHQRRPDTSIDTRWLYSQLKGLNVLLLGIPAGLALLWIEANPALILAANVVAVIPLSAIISDAADELSDYWGVLGGALINATFANVVELMFGLLAISHDEIHLAQSIMLGSVLSDILLVLGTCLIAAAKFTLTLHFNAAAADTLSSLMVVTAMALILPTVLHATFKNAANIDATVLLFSRLSAVVLLSLYLVYLYFQLVSHKEIFLDEVDETQDPLSPQSPESIDSPLRHINTNESLLSNQSTSLRHLIPSTLSESVKPTIVVLLASAVTIHCTHQILETTNATSKALGVSKTFIAMVVVPLASNATEFFSVIVASREHRMNFAIGVIVGSIIQNSLFILPLLVIVGWITGRPMTLDFGISRTATSFLAVLTVNNLISEGKYTYIHGTMLISLYSVLVLALLLQPET